MLVAGFPAGPWGTNCWVVAPGPRSECVVIDPGKDSSGSLAELLREHGLQPVAVVLTHGHIDHMWSVTPVCGDYGIPAYVHRDDRGRLVDPMISPATAAQLGLSGLTFTEPDDVRELTDGGVLDLAGIELGVRHAPGHTEGSVAYLLGGETGMFSGDLLFAGSIGRTDLAGGDPEKMEASLRRVCLGLPDETQVFPGHGEATTIGRERATNPFLLELERGGALFGPTRGM